MLIGAGLQGSHCSPFRILLGSNLLEAERDAVSPVASPPQDLQPFLPHVAPSPLMPYTNNTVPTLSGKRFRKLFSVFAFFRN